MMNISDDKLKNIVAQIEKGSVPEEILEQEGLDEEQKWYVMGYLKALEEKENSLEKLETVKAQIYRVRSKYCEPILQLLKKEGKLYHGDLAEKLDISPSGLNAIIKKINESDIPLVITEQIGKYKIYSLSQEAKNYFGHYKAPAESSNKNEKKVFVALQKLIDGLEENWREKLNGILCGEDKYPDESVKDRFQIFISHMLAAKQDCPEQYQEVLQFLKNEMLIYLLENYLQKAEHFETLLLEEIEEEYRTRDMEIVRFVLERI